MRIDIVGPVYSYTLEDAEELDAEEREHFVRLLEGFERRMNAESAGYVPAAKHEELEEKLARSQQKLAGLSELSRQIRQIDPPLQFEGGNEEEFKMHIAGLEHLLKQRDVKISALQKNFDDVAEECSTKQRKLTSAEDKVKELEGTVARQREVVRIADAELEAEQSRANENYDDYKVVCATRDKLLEENGQLIERLEKVQGNRLLEPDGIQVVHYPGDAGRCAVVAGPYRTRIGTALRAATTLRLLDSTGVYTYDEMSKAEQAVDDALREVWVDAAGAIGSRYSYVAEASLEKAPQEVKDWFATLETS